MRVAIDGSVFLSIYQKGIARYYYELLSRLEPDISATVYLQGKCCTELPIGVPVVTAMEYIGAGGRTPLALVTRLLRGLRRRYYPTRFPEGDLFHPTYYSMPTSGRMPMVVTVYDMLFERMRHAFPDSIELDIERKRDCIRAADQIVTISDATRHDLIHCYPEVSDRVTTVYLGCCHFRHAKIEDVEARKDRPYEFVLFVGQRKTYKNFLPVLDAMLDSHWPKEFSLVVAGEPFSDLEVEQIKVRGLQNRVILKVFPNDEKLKNLYETATTFVFPSLMEGFGFPLLEAQALGVPVVATESPVFREIGGDGFVPVNSQEPEAIARGVRQSFEAETRESLIEKGLANCQRFTWDECARKTFEVWRRCVVA